MIFIWKGSTVLLSIAWLSSPFAWWLFRFCFPSLYFQFHIYKNLNCYLFYSGEFLCWSPVGNFPRAEPHSRVTVSQIRLGFPQCYKLDFARACTCWSVLSHRRQERKCKLPNIREQIRWVRSLLCHWHPGSITLFSWLCFPHGVHLTPGNCWSRPMLYSCIC